MMEYIAGAGGLLLGSFLNVCISRLPDDYSISEPERSQCPNCGSLIEWYDNLPVLSFLLLRGRCRRCAIPISWRYPAVELLTGLLFFLAVRTAGWNWVGLKACVFSAILVELIFSDLETRILPDEFTKSGIVLGLLLAPMAPLPQGIVSLLLNVEGRALASLVDAGAGAALTSVGLWLIGEIYRRVRKRDGLGFGDVKLVALLGAFVGLEGAILAVMVSSVLGLVLGLGWIYWRGEDPAEYELPFGSFIGSCGLLVLFLAL